MTSQEAGMQAGLSRDVGLDHNIVVEEVDQERSYWENIRTLGKAGKWDSVLKILAEDTDRDSRSSIAQLLQPMNDNKDTIVHRAAFYGQTEVVWKLLDLLKKEDNQELWRKSQANIHGNNPLHLAAFNGYEDTCKCIADMALYLAKARNEDGDTPVFVAALSGHKKAFNTLTSMFLDDAEVALARRKDGDTILHCAISGEYFDLASTVIFKCKKLIGERNNRGLTPLHLLANNPFLFRSGFQLGLLESVFYSWIKVSTESKSDDLKCQKQEKHSLKSPGIEDSIESKSYDLKHQKKEEHTDQSHICVKKTLKWLIFVKKTLKRRILTPIGNLVLVIALCGIFFVTLPMLCLLYILGMFGFAWWAWIIKIPEIRNIKQEHERVKKVMEQLVDNIDHWREFGKWTRGINPATQQEIETASELDTNFMQKDPQTHTSPNLWQEDNKRGIIESPFLIAGKKGVKEMVQKILNRFPNAIDDLDSEDKNIMHLAAEHRQYEIYDLILKENGMNFFGKGDAEGNSVLHLAAKYPQEQAVLIPGAASQMYYEYRWFKLVMDDMPPSLSYRVNHNGKTAMEVFIKTHQDLATERAKWLRSASESCTVVAALITTVAFATISNVPGGLLQDKGIPVFHGGVNFNTFSISSFIAFCFSALSLIMFLGILFFPNQDLDFGNKKPSNLIWGINSLFISIVAMFLSFFTGDLFVLDKKMKYIAYPTFVLTFFMAISRSPFYSEFTSQAAFYYEFRNVRGGIPKRAYPDNLFF